MPNNIVKSIHLKDFTVFQENDLSFAKSINVISGENGVGKTHLMKALYSVGSCLQKTEESTSKRLEEELATKFVNVFRPDQLGRLVKRKAGRHNANVQIQWYSESSLSLSFATSSSKKVNLELHKPQEKWPTMVFIPVKEMISATENFTGLYETYHIAFEETYYDLNKQLLLPLKRGPFEQNQKELLKILEKALSGKIVQENNKFYLKQTGIGKLEMGLLAEGYRKISTIVQLIANGTIQENTILFWDEPESNINPKMIPVLTKLFVQLAKLGVQLFISTHSYFLMQELGLFAEYENHDKLDIQFVSMFLEEDEVKIETADQLKDLQHNVIEEEFQRLYTHEQELFFND
ncbi:MULTISPECIES: AAA family ATPase [Rummeliibacillus]|uniref:AAA family ATPase n=1 Tax=Rummeliibacillus TaxID=648802 RepID=UPI0011B582AC|nr:MULTISPECIES: AAA family ATPase [Rummeliibacillus]